MLTRISNSSYWIILRNTFTAFILLYGTLHVLFEAIYTIIPIGLIIIGLVSLLIYLIRIPPPDNSHLEAIIKSDHKDAFEATSNNVLKTIVCRGAGLDSPENSLEAFEICFNKGFYAVQFDIMLTADDVVIVYHDKTLERMTDSGLTINKSCWKELKDIDIAVKHPFQTKFKQVRIPTLSQAVEFILTFKETRIMIDIKDNNRKFIQIILDLYDKYPELYSRAVVTAFYPNLIYFIRRSNPKIVCGLGWRPKFFSNDAYNLQTGVGKRKTNNIFKYLYYVLCDNIHEWCLPRLTYSILGISLILLHKDIVNVKVVEEWRSKGVRVIAWNVNQPVEKQYFSRTVKVTYMTDTLTGESSVHSY